MTWTLAPVFHRVSLADAMAFAEARARKKAEQGKQGEKASSRERRQEAASSRTKADEPRVPTSEQVRIAVTQPRPAPSGVGRADGARVVTMKGDEVLPSADLVITANRITAVGPAGRSRFRPTRDGWMRPARRWRPGLIDTHAHLHYSGFETFPETKWEYAANLAYGVTTVYDPSAPSLDVFAQAELVEAGRMLGPRILSSGDGALRRPAGRRSTPRSTARTTRAGRCGA